MGGGGVGGPQYKLKKILKLVNVNVRERNQQKCSRNPRLRIRITEASTDLRGIYYLSRSITRSLISAVLSKLGVE